MSMQDVLSDFVARINNSIMVNKTEVEVLKNNVVVNVSKLLTKLGFFESFEIVDVSPSYGKVIVKLNLLKIKRLKRVSKPSLRVYTDSKKMPKITGGYGYTIISTPEGVKTHVDCLNKIGGEVLLQAISN